MKVRFGALGCGLMALLLLASVSFLPRGDPVQRLGRLLVKWDVKVGDLAHAVAALQRGVWSVEELVPRTPSERSFFVSRKGASVRGHELPDLCGMMRIVEKRPVRVGWIAIRLYSPKVGETRAPVIDQFMATLGFNLFALFETPSGKLLFPNPHEFLRRLGSPEAPESPIQTWEMPSSWEFPVAPRPREPFMMSTPRDPDRVNSEGFSLFAVSADAPAEEALFEFYQGLATAAARGAVIPTPLPEVKPSYCAGPFRSQHDLVTGEVPLEEAIRGLGNSAVGLRRGVGVSGGRARLVQILAGPRAGEANAIMRSREGVILRAIFPTDGREAALLRCLPQLGWDARDIREMPGDLTWSGRLTRHVWDSYVGEVHDLTEFAFEWIPVS